MKTSYAALILVTGVFTGACSETGKLTAFQALEQHSKYDCELASTNDCPRGPGNYAEYRNEREQLFREEAEKQTPAGQ